jgi:dipeptidyl-peptidase-3
LHAERQILELRVAAGGVRRVHETVAFKDQTIQLVYGDYDGRLSDVAHFIEAAIPHAANANQVEMLQHYVRHFREGPIDYHKNSQRAWIKDIGPTVETNIGLYFKF